MPLFSLPPSPSFVPSLCPHISFSLLFFSCLPLFPFLFLSPFSSCFFSLSPFLLLFLPLLPFLFSLSFPPSRARAYLSAPKLCPKSESKSQSMPRFQNAARHTTSEGSVLMPAIRRGDKLNSFAGEFFHHRYIMHLQHC